MNKPFTIKVQETEQEIIKIINNSELPAYVLITMLQNLITNIKDIDNKEINKYIDALKEKKEKKEE